MKYSFLLLFAFTILNAENFYYQNGTKIYLQQIKTQKSTNNIDYFIDQYDRKFGITDEIIVELDKDIKIDNIILKYSLKLISRVGESFYLLSVEDRKDIFKISALVHQEDGVKSANPNFIKKRFMR